MDELKDQIIKDHQQAELERLRAGYDGCGCQDCQIFYKTLDLAVYGNRVVKAGYGIIIIAGHDGADKWRGYHQGIDVERPVKASRTAQDRQGVISKPSRGIFLPPETSGHTFETTKKAKEKQAEMAL